MSRHGTLRGLEYVNRSSVDHGRFGRMFRALPGEIHDEEALRALSVNMVQEEVGTLINKTRSRSADLGPEAVFNPHSFPLDKPLGEPEPDDENPTIPAGYTYVGQFIDHDITFDPNSSLERQNDPDATENFRTPRLDLDSLYGRGPDADPFIYDKRHYGEFLHGSAGRRRGDLPRNEQQTALIGDPRNDENRIVSQLHCIFLAFHNKVLRALRQSTPTRSAGGRLFLEAQRIVRWHYQYLALNDYLKRVVGPETWDAVFGMKPHTRASAGSTPQLKFYRPKTSPFIPVEFSIAAFRFGHSMVRPTYALGPRADVGGDPALRFTGDPQRRFHRIPIFSDVSDQDRYANANIADLRGKQVLPPGWEIDWRLFFGAPDSAPQLSYRLDEKLVDPLAMLPLDGDSTRLKSLAFRNLLRGNAFALPSGENVARFLNVPVLTPEQLWPKRTPGADFEGRSPLWYYILREAAQQKLAAHPDPRGGHHLGPCGGRIVAEVLGGLLVHDHGSYLHQHPGWTPAIEQERSGFRPEQPITTFAELIHWTTDGKMTLANTP